MDQSRKPAQAPARVRKPVDLNPTGFCTARNSAKNHTQPEQAIPVGEPSGKARRMSSGNVVRRAAWSDLKQKLRQRLEARRTKQAIRSPATCRAWAGDPSSVICRFTLAGFLV